MMGKRILVVDDEPKMRRVLEIMLQKIGHAVVSAGNGVEALRCIAEGGVDLVITDLRMPGMDGIELLAELRGLEISTPVIVITAYGTIESAVDAMKRGACDYILRPFDIDALELAVGRVFATEELARENTFLRQEVDRGWSGFVGTGPSMQKVYELIRQIAPTKSAVLITGETGTGKELAARSVHQASPRRDKLFVPINCAAIPADILESELFGYEKGAFTGATRERIGKFELANEGTVFLDELTEMPVALQAKLLRVLQESSVERLGGNCVIPLDIRIVTAMNRNPREAIRDGRLREDLYYRINVFSIDLPPLRARPEDIPSLVTHFIAKHWSRAETLPKLTARAEAHLRAYAWPGNVRELENMIERALVLSGGAALDVEHFPLETALARDVTHPADTASLPSGTMNEVVDQIEANMILDALQRVQGNKAKAAALLDISERSLWYKLKKYRIDHK